MGWKLLAQGNDACWEHMVVSVLQLRTNYFAIQLDLTGQQAFYYISVAIPTQAIAYSIQGLL